MIRLTWPSFRRDETDRQRPEFVIGFAVTPEQARDKFFTWIRENSWFRPGDLRAAQIVDKQKGIYLPFWSFSMLAESQWQATIGEYWYRTETYTEQDSKGNTVTKTRQVRETEWWPLSGRHHRYHSGHLVSGSRGLQQLEADRLMPFQLPAMKRYLPHFIAGWLCEEYSIAREDALAICQQEFFQREQSHVAGFLPGDTHRDLHVQTQFSRRELGFVPAADLLVDVPVQGPDLPVSGQRSNGQGRRRKAGFLGSDLACRRRRGGPVGVVDPVVHVVAGAVGGMSETLEKCTVCGALLDEEDLFCPNCGTEAPPAFRRSAGVARAPADAQFPVSGLRRIHELRRLGSDAALSVLRLGANGPAAGRQAAVRRPRRAVCGRSHGGHGLLRKWLGSGFWRPGDLAASSVVTTMTPVFVPYWVFEARTFTYWTADSSETPLGARGDWVPLFGEHRGSYAGLLIGASGALTPAETESLCPFDLSAAQPYEAVDTDNVIVEQFRVQRKYARPLASQGLENLARIDCQKYVPGRCRNLKVNVKLEGLSSATVLLPVWIMAYRYRDQVYRFLVNGQTGRATGQAPVSWKKVFAAIAIVALLAFLLFLIFLGLAAA